MLKKTSLSLLQKLVSSKEKNIEKLIVLLNISRKQFWYELQELNNELLNTGLKVIDHNCKELFISQAMYDQFNKIVDESSIDFYQYQNERIYFLYLYIVCNKGYISSIHLQEYLGLSRNASMKELKKLREWIGKEGLSINYSRTNGYEVTGYEKDIRRMMEICISKLKNKFPLDKVYFTFKKDWQDHKVVEAINNYLIELSQKYHLNILHDRAEEFIYLLAFMKQRDTHSSIEFNEWEIRLLDKHFMLNLAKELVNDLLGDNTKSEIHFWESRMLGIFLFTPNDQDKKFFDRLTEEILLKANTIMGVNFIQDSQLKMTLCQHIIPAFYRLVFDIYYDNPLLEKIKEEYEDLFEITRKILEPLESKVNNTISESEIAYFTIHFGGYLSRYSPKINLKAAVVCPNGISSSLIMSSTIKNIFPDLQITQLHSLQDLTNSTLKDIDMVFTTTYLTCEKPVFTISPILNPIEQEVLREKVSSEFSELSKPYSVNSRDILKIVEKHAAIEDRNSLLKEIQNYLYRERGSLSRLGEVKNLTEIFDSSMVQTVKHVDSWVEAIKKASEPLLNKEYIEKEYVDAMIETVNNIGPYIVLAPQVAVPHARPERGVNKLGISLLKIEDPVDFNTEHEKDPEKFVNLVFVLAAIDGEAHLKALVQLSKILDNEDNIKEIIELDNPIDIYEKIENLVNQMEGE